MGEKHPTAPSENIREKGPRSDTQLEGPKKGDTPRDRARETAREKWKEEQKK